MRRRRVSIPATGQEYWLIDMVRQFGATVPQWYAGQCPLVDRDRAILAPGGEFAVGGDRLPLGPGRVEEPQPARLDR